MLPQSAAGLCGVYSCMVLTVYCTFVFSCFDGYSRPSPLLSDNPAPSSVPLPFNICHHTFRVRQYSFARGRGGLNPPSIANACWRTRKVCYRPETVEAELPGQCESCLYCGQRNSTKFAPALQYLLSLLDYCQ